MTICIYLAGSILAPFALPDQVYHDSGSKGEGDKKTTCPWYQLELKHFFGRVISFPAFTPFLIWQMRNTLGSRAGKTNNLFVQIFFLQQHPGKTSLKLNSVTATTAHLLLLPLTHQPPTTPFTRHHYSQKAGGHDARKLQTGTLWLLASLPPGNVAGVGGHLMNLAWWLSQKEHHSLLYRDASIPRVAW